MSEKQLPIEKRKKHFEFARKHRDAESIDRTEGYGEDRFYVSRDFANYESSLPMVESDMIEFRILDILRERFRPADAYVAGELVMAELVRAIEEGRVCRVYDLGCGDGKPLASLYDAMESRYGFEPEALNANLALTGISLNDFRGKGELAPDKEQAQAELDKRRIRYYGGEGHSIEGWESILEQQSQESGTEILLDVVMSNQAIGYIKPTYVTMEVISSIYSRLRPGGIALLDVASLNSETTHEDWQNLFGSKNNIKRDVLDKINEYFEKTDLNIRMDIQMGKIGLVMIKNEQPISLPFTFDSEGNIDGVNFESEDSA